MCLLVSIWAPGPVSPRLFLGLGSLPLKGIWGCALFLPLPLSGCSFWGPLFSRVRFSFAWLRPADTDTDTDADADTDTDTDTDVHRHRHRHRHECACGV